MDPRKRDIYLTEIETQCRAVRSAAAAVEFAHARLREDRGHGAHSEIFRNIHSLLTHASNVSRMLWPGAVTRRRGEAKDQYQARRDAAADRAAALRTVLNVPDDHALKDRTLRDHLEHFDERLDDWNRTSLRHNYVQDVIGPPGAVVGFEETDMMRWFDPTSGSFRFRGESYDLREIVAAAEAVLVSAIVAHSDPSLVSYKLQEEFPNMLFSWEDLRSEVSSAVFADARLDSTLVASIHFAPYMKTATLQLGMGGTIGPVTVELPASKIPGDRSQVEPIAKAIVASVLQHSSRAGT